MYTIQTVLKRHLHHLHSFEKIKKSAHKNIEIDAKCEKGLNMPYLQRHTFVMLPHSTSCNVLYFIFQSLSQNHEKLNKVLAPLLTNEQTLNAHLRDYNITIQKLNETHDAIDRQAKIIQEHVQVCDSDSTIITPCSHVMFSIWQHLRFNIVSNTENSSRPAFHVWLAIETVFEATFTPPLTLFVTSA